MYKKLLKIGLILGITLTIGSNAAYGQISTDKLKVDEICFNDWQTFSSAIISYNSFTEFWEDIFVRYNKNLCHYTDIAKVLDQIDAARDEIKKNFLSCNAAQAVIIRDKYYELEFELFFLRNFIDIPSSEIQEIPADKVLEMLRQEFVLNKGYFDETKAKELFDRFKKKYQGKVKTTYKNCVDPDIAALKKKWNSLKDTIKSMGQDAGKSIKSEWSKAINNPPKGMEDFIKGVQGFRLNKLPAFPTPDTIVKDLSKDLQKSSGSSEPTLFEAQQKIDQVQTAYINKVNTTSVKAEYEALYKKGGDSLAESYVKKIQEINKIVLATFDPLSKVKECAKKTGERQCQ